MNKQLERAETPATASRVPGSLTREDQVYRIGGTTSGAAIMAGATASYFIGSSTAVMIGAIVGGVIGLYFSVYAASQAHTPKA